MKWVSNIFLTLSLKQKCLPSSVCKNDPSKEKCISCFKQEGGVVGERQPANSSLGSPVKFENQWVQFLCFKDVAPEGQIV